MIGMTFFSASTQKYCWRCLGSIDIKKLLKVNINNTEDNGNDCISNSSNNGGFELRESEDESDSDDDDNEEEDNDDDNDDTVNLIDKEDSKKYTTTVIAKKLITLSNDDFPYIFLGIFFHVTCSIAEIFLPYYAGKTVNYIVIGKSMEFKQAITIMILIALASGFASGFAEGIFTYLYARFEYRIQYLLFKSILNMEIGFFDVRKTEEITSRLTSDCTKLGEVSHNISIFLKSIVKIIAAVFFMFKLSWKLSIVIFFSLLVFELIFDIFENKHKKLSEKVQASFAAANESAEEAISCIRTVRSFAAEKEEAERYSTKLLKTFRLRKKKSILLCGKSCCLDIFIVFVIPLIIFYYGGHLVMQNALSGGNLFAFTWYCIQADMAFESFDDADTKFNEAVRASKNVILYIDRKPKIDLNGSFIPDGGITGDIQFKDVSFSYPSQSDVQVLNKVNFSVTKGEVVALVGPSGSGKSSIVNLLEHFYEPNTGQVLIDSINVRDYDHKFIHSKMSIVQQEPNLFARTVSENICYGIDPPVDDNLIKSSAVMANAHMFIEDLPEKYNTETGEKGIQLSGGQKQRVAIARALIRDPSILILDEATSALDSESEYLVQQALNKNLEGRAVLIIAHRLSTVEKADKIIVIEKGEIVEQGNHLELIKKEGVYAGLVNRQMLNTEENSSPIEPAEHHAREACNKKESSQS